MGAGGIAEGCAAADGPLPPAPSPASRERGGTVSRRLALLVDACSALNPPLPQSVLGEGSASLGEPGVGARPASAFHAGSGSSDAIARRLA
jgi:hypothetical protein